MLSFIWELYCMLHFFYLFKCLQFCTLGVWPVELWTSTCGRWAIEVFLFILGIYQKPLSLGFSKFLGETLSISLQNLGILLRCVNVPDLEYSDGWNPMWGCHLQLVKGLIQCQVRCKHLDEEMLYGEISFRWTSMRWTSQWVLISDDNS